MNLIIPSFQLSSIGPWLTLTVTAILILVLDALSPKGRKICFSWVALAGLAVAAFQTIGLWGSTGTDFARMVYLDNFAFFFYLIFILGAALLGAGGWVALHPDALTGLYLPPRSPVRPRLCRFLRLS